MSNPESYTILALGGIPQNLDLAAVSPLSDNPLYAVLGTIQDEFLGSWNGADETLEPPDDGVLRIALGGLDNGNENATLKDVLSTLRELGISYDVDDSGSFEWNPSAAWWRPGMVEPLRYQCDHDGVATLPRNAVESALAEFPEALDAIRKLFPSPPPLKDAPAAEIGVVITT